MGAPTDLAVATACLVLALTIATALRRQGGDVPAWPPLLAALCLAALGVHRLTLAALPRPLLRPGDEGQLLAAGAACVTGFALWHVLRRSGRDPATGDGRRPEGRRRGGPRSAPGSSAGDGGRGHGVKVGAGTTPVLPAALGPEHAQDGQDRSARTLQRLMATSPVAVVEAEAVAASWQGWQVRRWSARARDALRLVGRAGRGPHPGRARPRRRRCARGGGCVRDRLRHRLPGGRHARDALPEQHGRAPRLPLASLDRQRPRRAGPARSSSWSRTSTTGSPRRRGSTIWRTTTSSPACPIGRCSGSGWARP